MKAITSVAMGLAITAITILAGIWVFPELPHAEPFTRELLCLQLAFWLCFGIWAIEDGWKSLRGQNTCHAVSA